MSSPHTPTPSGTIPAQGQSKARPASEAFSPSPLTDIETPTPHSNADPFGRPESPSAGRQTRPRKSVKSSHSDTATGSAGRPGSVPHSGSNTSEGLEVEEDLADEYLIAPLGNEPNKRWTPDPEEDQEPEDDYVGDPNWTSEEPRTRRKPKAGLQPAAAIEASPIQRTTAASIKTEAKELAKASDPNRGRCLLTGMDQPAITRQWAHILARATKPDELTTIERQWRMAYYSLYIDSRYNLVPLKSDWHLPLDNASWALVPHHKLISDVLKWIKSRRQRKRKNDDSDRISKLWETESGPSHVNSQSVKIKMHTYFMLPLNDSLRTVPIHRRVGDFDPEIPEIRHLYPYRTLGPLSSHIQPHFVIYAVGAKLENIRQSKGDAFIDWLASIANDVASFGYRDAKDYGKKNLVALQNIMSIYEGWTDRRVVPKDGDPWYNPGK
ncbi:hypothetical protein B0H11DRAFT_934129 [Mycena galericulata]|nr:hypothetical protein B0H11DRAFT_934129 [Mycena galericulata]